MNTELKLILGGAVATAFLTACSQTAEAQPTIDVAGISNQVGTEIAGTLFASAATVTATPDLPSPTITPLSEPTPTITGSILNEQEAVAFALSGVISEFPSSMNVAGDESTGETHTSEQKILEYFSARRILKESTEIQKYDRAYGQFSQPVNPNQFKDRDLNFGWDGYGLGFSAEDDANFVANNANNEMNFQLDADGYHRASVLTSGRSFEGMVKDGIENYYRSVLGVEPTDAQILSMFSQIIFEDWGIQAPDDGDNNQFTLNDHFEACQTYTGPALTRLEQQELARRVTFDPDVETNDGDEDERVNLHDSDNDVYVVMVSDGSQLWAEFYEAVNDPDPLNPALNSYGERAGSRIALKRLVPCGSGEAAAGSTPTIAITPGFPLPSMEVTMPPTLFTQQPSATQQGPQPTVTPRPGNPGGTPTRGVPTGEPPKTPVPTPQPQPSNTPEF